MFRFFRRRKKQEQIEEQQDVAQELQEKSSEFSDESVDSAESVEPAESVELADSAQLIEPDELSGSAESVRATTPVSEPDSELDAAPKIKAEPEAESEPKAEPKLKTGPHRQPESAPQAAPAEALEAEVIATEAVDITEKTEATEKPKRSWFSRLRSGLARTGQSISSIFVGVPVDEDLFEELETALIMADAGMEATDALLSELRARVRKDRLTDAGQVKEALQEILAEHLAPLEKAFPLDAHHPLVVMIAGVNGAGKTTSIGKLAKTFQAQDASVLLAAGDTFRAAAREQLIEWGERNNVAVIAQEGGDPAAVSYDAVHAAQARDIDVVMVDTAGRLPTQLHLMDELKKIRRVVGKAYEGSPHEVLLVVDGNTGQNALAQIRAFDEAIELTGLIVTKLDGTARGGILAAVASGTQGVRPVPVYWIGVGEGVDDLQPFDAQEFAAALLAGD
ncbi:MAG TPA: signal recognition particle-docking protein FtsY [Paenalcaligenes sp.]|nr:signal recognition particle-docking protein FtsY [Paenalcaligenes sp.]